MENENYEITVTQACVDDDSKKRANTEGGELCGNQLIVHFKLVTAPTDGATYYIWVALKDANHEDQQGQSIRTPVIQGASEPTELVIPFSNNVCFPSFKNGGGFLQFNVKVTPEEAGHGEYVDINNSTWHAIPAN